MSEVIIGGLLKLTFGLVTKKLRTYGAEKLQDGGLTDQKFRGWIVSELDDIKSKLDAISRKDLCASISFLQQGTQRLYVSFGESSESENSSELPGKQSQATTTASAGACSTNKASHQTVAVEDAVALANAIGKLKIESNERLELGKESFKNAAIEATRAFHNAALSTDERILASKVRIASGILQHLEDPELAATDCLQYLRELHDMPAIKEIFSVHVKKGIKSWFKSSFKKDSRAEIVESVMMINWILADFITKFTKRRMAVFDWPMIECGKRVVHPIHHHKKILPNMKEITPPWNIVETQKELKRQEMLLVIAKMGKKVMKPWACALTTKGDVICCTENRRGLQKLDKATGKLRPYCSLRLEDNTKHRQSSGKLIIDIAMDKDDTVYVLSRDDEDKYTLSIYSADGRNTHHCSLNFLQEMSRFRHISVSNNKNIVVCFNHADKIMVFLCNCMGSLINSFELPFPSISGVFEVISVSVSCDNEIILTARNFTGCFDVLNELYIYSTDGQLKTTVKFHPSEREDDYDRLCYNHDTNTIIGMAWDREDNKMLIEYLSGQTAKLQLSYVLYNTNFPEGIFHSDLLHHTNTGTLALVSKNHVLLLQNPSS